MCVGSGFAIPGRFREVRLPVTALALGSDPGVRGLAVAETGVDRDKDVSRCTFEGVRTTEAPEADLARLSRSCDRRRDFALAGVVVNGCRFRSELGLALALGTFSSTAEGKKSSSSEALRLIMDEEERDGGS